MRYQYNGLAIVYRVQYGPNGARISNTFIMLIVNIILADLVVFLYHFDPIPILNQVQPIFGI